MHVLITGGAGFIGSHLAEFHLRKGDKVHVVDDFSTGRLENLASFQDDKYFRCTNADILTWDGLGEAAAWADRIYHMAAMVGVFHVLAEPIKTLAVNIAGCERLLRAVKAGGWHPKIVIASSSEVYGNGEDNDFDEAAQLEIASGSVSRWNYAISKLTDESLGLSYYRDKTQLPITIVRLFNTTGPRQRGRYGMVVPRLCQQAVAGAPLTVYGDGTQTRSFCDVRDTVRALDALCETTASNGEIVNVGHDQEISILDLAKKVRALAGSSSEIRHISYEEAYDHQFEDIRCRSASFTKLKRLTQLEYHYSLDETLSDMIVQFRTLVDEVA